MAEQYEQHLDIPALVTIGAVFVILVLLAVVGTQAFFRYEQGKINWLRAVEAPNDQLDEMNAAQVERISEYRWVDREKGIAAIPIDRAMELYADKLSRR